MLDTFGLAKGGKEYRRIVAAFERIFGATIFFGTDTARPTAKLVHRVRFSFLHEAHIWYNRDGQPADLFENVIVLSDEFFAEALAHPIPADLDAVRILASAPAVLDLFLWLTCRCFTAKGEELVPLFGPFGLTQQLGSVEYSRPRRSRAMLEQWLATIRCLWPTCPARIASNGNSLLIANAAAIAPRFAGSSPRPRLRRAQVPDPTRSGFQATRGKTIAYSLDGQTKPNPETANTTTASLR